MYDKECYQRHKMGVVKKLTLQEFECYKQIRERWGFDDCTIRNLLMRNTMTEILE